MIQLSEYFCLITDWFKNFVQKKMSFGENQWYRVISHELKLHICPENLLDSVKKDAESKHSVKWTEDVMIDSVNFFIHETVINANRVVYDIILPGITISIPATNIERFYQELENSRFRGGEENQFVKLHGAFSCLILSKEHCDIFHKQLVSVLKNAETISQFEAELKYDALLEMGISTPKPVGYEEIPDIVN